MLEKQLFIINEYVDATSNETIAIHSPHDGSLVADGIQVASLSDVDRAVEAAKVALNGEWSSWTPMQRSAAMLRFADLADKQAAELAELESRSMGATIRTTTALWSMVGMAYRYYAGWTDKIHGEQWPEENGTYRIVQYEPIGVVAGIGAWNGTGGFFGFKIASGSEKSPIALLQAGKLFKEAGFPPGVVNILTGDGRVGAALSHHMGVNKVTFPGSLAAGRKIMEAAAKSNLKRVTLELGGKSPSLIFPDADLENALQHTSQYFLGNTSQQCVAASRLFVHKSIAEGFIKQLKERFEQCSRLMGSPLDPNMAFGPVIDRIQFESVMTFIEADKTEAELLTGGTRKGDSGYYIEPTIFLNPDNDARIYRQEIFGPVLVVRTFETEDEAMKLANDTSYGLSSCIYTSSMPRALRLAKRITAGNVNINSSQTFASNVPFGGFKESGVGREGGKHGLMAFLEAKTIHINMKV